jgi:kynurenine 3-monooxygenase
MADRDSITQQQRKRKALVIGAGPVGALTALSLHRRGWEVEVWESREGESDRYWTLSLGKCGRIPADREPD